MAVVATGLTSASNTALTSSKTTASVTLPVNTLILLAVANYVSAGGPNNVASVTSTGATWEFVIGGTYNVNTRRMEIWRTMVNPARTGAITINYAAVTNRAAWSVISFANVPVTGLNGEDAIIQALEEALLFPGPPFGEDFVTLGAFADAGNATYGACSIPLTGCNAGSGFTEIHDKSAGPSNPTDVETEFRNDNDTTVTWGFSGSAEGVGVGMEIGFATGTNHAQALAATSTFTPTLGRGYGKMFTVDSTFAPAARKGIATHLAATSAFAQGFSTFTELAPGHNFVTLAAQSAFTPAMDAERQGTHGNHSLAFTETTNHRLSFKEG